MRRLARALCLAAALSRATRRRASPRNNNNNNNNMVAATTSVHKTTKVAVKRRHHSGPSRRPSPPSQEPPGSLMCGYDVEKTVFSNHTRFVFVAGLAGSGLQAFAAFARGCGALCRTARPSTTRLLHYRMGLQAHGIFDLGGDRSVTAAKIRMDRDAFVAALDAEASTPGVVLLNSPPTLKYAGAYLKHPNVHVLAALAERAAVDLRVFVLDRDGAAVVDTNARRGHVASGTDIISLADSAAVLTQQINMISPTFVRRVPFPDLGDAAFWEKDDFAALAFLHPRLATSDFAGNMTANIRTGARREPQRPTGPTQNKSNATLDALYALDDAKVDLARARVEAMTDALSASLAARRSPYFLEKRQYSNDTRLVFVAGLEGTGHHATNILFKDCRTLDLCASSLHLSSLLYAGGREPHGVFIYPKDKSPYGGINHRRIHFVETLRRLRNASKLVVLNTLMADDTPLLLGQKAPPPISMSIGMMSFPNFLGKTRAYQHIDVHELAYLAEKAGVDLRVLVLARGAREILLSTTVHRHFEPKPNQAALLADSAAALAAQLQLLDDRFFLCVPYAQIGNTTWWTRPARRAAPSPARHAHTPAIHHHTNTPSRAAWLHPRLPDIVTRIVSTIYNRHPEIPPTLQSPKMDLDAFTSRDDLETTLAASADYLHRTAGCSCGA